MAEVVAIYFANFITDNCVNGERTSKKKDNHKAFIEFMVLILVVIVVSFLTYMFLPDVWLFLNGWWF